jgi:hypothetical protein
MQNYKQNQKIEKQVKTQDSMGKANFFLGTLPFNSWVVSTMWLHTQFIKKIHEK